MYAGKDTVCSRPAAVVLNVSLTFACAAVSVSGTYPIPSDSDTTELLNCAVGRYDSFKAKFAIKAFKCVLYANTSRIFDNPDASKL